MAKTAYSTPRRGERDDDGIIHDLNLDIDDRIVSEAHDLYYLIETISDEMAELDYTRPDGSRNARLDRIAALVEIARRQIRSLHNVVVDNYGNIDGRADESVAKAA